MTRDVVVVDERLEDKSKARRERICPPRTHLDATS